MAKQENSLEDRPTCRDQKYWQDPFDLLDTNLHRAVERSKHRMPELSVRRSAPATGTAEYRVYWDTSLDKRHPQWLGTIELRRMADKVTDVVVESMVTGVRAIPFEQVVDLWKNYVENDKVISRAVIERSNTDTEKNIRPRGKPGRPHLPDDVWAWEQVNTHGRLQSEAYKEWLDRPGVKARNLVDPERQFNRVIKLDWGNKPGQNI